MDNSKLKILLAALQIATAHGDTTLMITIRAQIRKLEKKYRTGF